MAHTKKHLIQSISGGDYEYRIFSSGGILHTVYMACRLNGRCEVRSFHGFKAAMRWVELKIELHAEFKSNAVGKVSDAVS